jgi:GNAT superfamily N-acetyltransferase
MPQLEIRRGRSSDTEALRIMVQSVWMEIYAPQLSEERIEACGADYFADLVGDPSVNGWLAVRGDQYLGYGQINANCIDQLWVSARVRRRGIGTRLLTQMLDAIGTRGFAHAQIGCEDFNTGALNFLHALGWEPVGSAEQGLGAGRFCKALIFSKALKSPSIHSG